MIPAPKNIQKRMVFFVFLGAMIKKATKKNGFSGFLRSRGLFRYSKPLLPGKSFPGHQKPEKPEKQFFFVAFLIMAPKKTKKTILFCMFLWRWDQKYTKQNGFLGVSSL